MIKIDPTATRETRITNDAPGARYVNTVEGPVIIAAGATSAPVTVTEGELADLTPGLREHTAEPEASGSDLEGAGTAQSGQTFTWPADLASASSADGLIKRDDLIALAKDEGVTFESDDNKPQIAAKIVAKRREAAAGQ